MESREIIIAIPGGKLIASVSADPEPPGIFIKYEMPDGTRVDVTGVEAKSDGKLTGYIWTDPDRDYYTESYDWIPPEPHGLTWKELFALAEKNYDKGGYVIVDRWNEDDYRRYAEKCGSMTEEFALQYFKETMESDDGEARHALTWEELYLLGEKLYKDGGHVVVDNWTEVSFNSYVEEHGPVTMPIALLIFSGIPRKDWDSPKEGLSWDKVLEWANKSYDAGGYAVVKFWGEEHYKDWSRRFGPVTYRKLFTQFTDLYDPADRPEESCDCPYDPILTFDELQDIAQKHYYHGGDVIADCWDRAQFDRYVKEFGPVTLSDAAELIAKNADKNEERSAIMQQIMDGEW